MGVSSSESHDLTAFYELLTASFGALSQNTGFYPSLDRIVETMLGPLNLGPGGRSYNKPISRLHRPIEVAVGGLIVSSLCGGSGCYNLCCFFQSGLVFSSCDVPVMSLTLSITILLSLMVILISGKYLCCI